MNWLALLVISIFAVCAIGLLFLVCVAAWHLWTEMSGTKPLKCNWRYDGDLFKTNCGKSFIYATEDQSSITDWITYCPYCGKKVNKK